MFMGEFFEKWLKEELEKAKRDAQSAETWTRKSAQDRTDKLQGALMVLGEFRALHKDRLQD